MHTNKFLILFCFFIINSIIAFAADLPSVRYVTARDGLNRREFPTLTSNRLGTLLYGSRIIAHERSSNKETIDGITDYWYRCSGGIPGGGGGFYWVFGGYLSTTIPEDTKPVLGFWNTSRGARYFWSFRPDYTASSGIRETGTGWQGTWTLSGNKLTIVRAPIEFHIGESGTVEIIITVINRDLIILTFPDGSTETLTRSNDLV